MLFMSQWGNARRGHGETPLHTHQPLWGAGWWLLTKSAHSFLETQQAHLWSHTLQKWQFMSTQKLHPNVQSSCTYNDPEIGNNSNMFPKASG